jgi:hypothetical protein
MEDDHPGNAICNADVVARMIRRKTDPNALSEDSDAAILCAATYGHTAVIDALIAANVNTNFIGWVRTALLCMILWQP